MLLPNTRFSPTNDVVESALAQHQHQLISLLPNDAAFLAYKNSCTTRERQSVEEMLASCNYLHWARMETLLSLTDPIRASSLLCSSATTTLSCHPLVAHVLHNAIMKTTGEHGFDIYFG